MESVIEEVEEELENLEGEEKERLEEKLNNIKEEYDDDIKSRIEKNR